MVGLVVEDAALTHLSVFVVTPREFKCELRYELARFVEPPVLFKKLAMPCEDEVCPFIV